MSEAQYWDGDCALAIAFRRADELRCQRQNQMLWLQGMYIYEALCDVSPVLHAFAKAGTRPAEYRGEPYPLTRRQREQQQLQEMEKERLRAIAYFKNWAKANQTNQKEVPPWNREQT